MRKTSSEIRPRRARDHHAVLLAHPRPHPRGVQPARRADRRHRVARALRLGEQLQPERRHPRPGARAQPLVARDGAGDRLLLDQPQRRAQPAQQGDCRRVGRLALVRPALHLRVVEVEARNLRVPGRLPRPRAHGGKGQPRRGHPRLLGAGRPPRPGPSRPARRSAVSTPLIVSTRISTSGEARRAARGDRPQVGQHSRRGLVVGQQHGADRAVRGQRLRHLLRLRRAAPLDLHPLHVRPHRLRDVGEPVPERPAGHRQHPVAGREGVHHAGLQPAGPRSGKDEQVVRRLVAAADALHDGFLERRVLGAAVVDHRLRQRAEHRRPGTASARESSAGACGAYSDSPFQPRAHNLIPASSTRQRRSLSNRTCARTARGVGNPSLVSPVLRTVRSGLDSFELELELELNPVPCVREDARGQRGVSNPLGTRAGPSWPSPPSPPERLG